MNAGFGSHVREDVLEKYALLQLSDAECVPLEEHLLVCPVCQTRLDELDDYIQVVKAAIATLTDQTTSSAPRFGPGRALTAAGLLALILTLMLP